MSDPSSADKSAPPKASPITLLSSVNNARFCNARGVSINRTTFNFLDKEEIVDVKDFYKEALDEHLGSYIPEDKRNFFWITAHLDPKPLFSHLFHWFELAEMDFNPSQNVLRKGPLLYNIFDSRNEGVATAVEEMFMQTGLYENNPRSKEIVYILIAQRAARGLGSLYAHANLMSMEEAGKIHSEYTPRGWMKTEKESDWSRLNKFMQFRLSMMQEELDETKAAFNDRNAPEMVDGIRGNGPWWLYRPWSSGHRAGR